MWSEIIQLIQLPPTDEKLKRRRVGVMVMFIILAVLFSVVTPIFEISDELRHYPVIDYMADTGGLPVQNVNQENLWDWEAAQPPLYYALGAILVAPFDRDDMETHLERNPHAKEGLPLARDNQNLVLHGYENENFPWRGTPLHVHLVRLMSVLMGAVAVWLTFTIARLTFPHNPAIALIAMCLTAFNPMFLAISGSVNNDNAVNMFVPLTLAVMLTTWRYGFSWQRVGAMALFGTLAAASKVSGAIVLVPAGLMIAAVVWRDRLPLRYVIISAVIFAGVWGILLGWWYIRNLDLYGDFFGTAHMIETVGGRDSENTLTVLELLQQEKGSFFAAYWGVFGGFNVLAPGTLFLYALILWIVAGVGLMVSVIKITRSPEGAKSQRDENFLATTNRTRGFNPWKNTIPILLLLLALALATVSLMSWSLQTQASQGRLLFPFMAIISTFTAFGLVTVLKRRLAQLAIVPLAAFAMMSVGYVIPAAYRPAKIIESLPEDAQKVDVRFGQIELLGYKIGDSVAERHDPEATPLEITLYWRATEPTKKPLSFYVQIFGPGDNGEPVEVGKLDSYPSGGIRRTDTWQTGVIYEERYHIPLDKEAPHLDSYEPRFKIGWRDNETDIDIPATASDGSSIEAVIARGGAVWDKATRCRDNQTDVKFGNLVQLRDFEISTTELSPGESLDLHLSWHIESETDDRFTLFVQVVNPDDITQIIGSGDSVPRQDWYPTSTWVKDVCFDDVYHVGIQPDAPPGQYRILIGFYRPTDFMRLPVKNSPFPDAFMLTDEITITELAP